jgi:RPA family protein
MPVQRQTAKLVRIVDLVSGEWVKKEGMEPSYVITPRRDTVSRARIIGTIVTKFISEDGNFASVTLDDSTATIQGKMWKETGLITKTNVGDLVNLTGKVREYEGDIYIVPEIILTVNPDQESMLRLEILAMMKEAGKAGEGKAGEDGGEKAGVSGPAKTGNEDLRRKILSVIEGSKDGIKYSELVEKAGVAEEELENVINELLGEGICYEPTPGKIKKI